jgi:Acetyl-coenzyme A synthetase N-terminus
VAGRLVWWRKPWETVLEWDPGRPDERGHYFRWYVGGVTNMAWNAVDRQVE